MVNAVMKGDTPREAMEIITSQSNERASYDNARTALQEGKNPEAVRAKLEAADLEPWKVGL